MLFQSELDCALEYHTETGHTGCSNDHLNELMVQTTTWIEAGGGTPKAVTDDLWLSPETGE